ncbi:MAG: DUF3048 domain-containing protein [Actinomycetota bacterium]|nr:DUF3048 domain-containing protein [Actinomycetota bacterium]
MLGAGALVLAACGGATTTHRDAAPKAASTTTTHSTATAALCPLTGAPVPGGGAVPQRPALAVKVDNYPAARPQSGLTRADIVFEEPVEGRITRYVAVFQCQQAALIGPIRSARNIDIGILGEFGKPILAHMGGIPPVLANIDASPIIDLNLIDHGTLTHQMPGRVAPYSTYSATASLWGAFPTDTTVPAPVFSYSSSVPTGHDVSAVSKIAIPFSSESNVVWKFNPGLDEFQRYYGTTPDKLSNGVQNSAANVVVQEVQITYGPWVENATGGLEVQANLYTDASGLALVFRNGAEITGTWSRSSLGQATQFTSTTGQPISLQPGPTWVEIVPNTVTVTATAPTAGSGGSAPPVPTTTTTHPRTSNHKK